MFNYLAVPYMFQLRNALFCTKTLLYKRNLLNCKEESSAGKQNGKSILKYGEISLTKNKETPYLSKNNTPKTKSFLQRFETLT